MKKERIVIIPLKLKICKLIIYEDSYHYRARPQFIKAAVVSRVFSVSSEVEEVIVHTGQHFDANMSDVFF